MKKELTVIVLIASLTLCVGCGNTKELDEYYTSMNDSIVCIHDTKEQLDNIDTEDESASTEVLALLDEFENEFENLSSIDVPKEFSANETLADDAYSYMSEANTLFHQYFNDSESDSTVYDAAMENYTRAMTRLSYISSILKGEVPEGEGVTFTEEDGADFTPVIDEEAE